MPSLNSSYMIFFLSYQVQLIHPQPGWVEIDPHVLWEQFVDVITEVMEGMLGT